MRKLLLLFSILLIGVTAQAQIIDEGTCGANLTWVLTADGTLTISGKGNMYDYSTGGAPWYSNCNSITTLVIGEKVNSIGKFAFSDCSKLTNISIPEDITTIEDGAFYNCGSLENVRLEDGAGVLAIKSYNMNAFDGCQITDLYIGRDLRTMGGIDYSPTFNDQKFLETLTIGDKYVTSIRASDFSGCVSLANVTIGSKVTKIGSSAFSGCNSLPSIILPNTPVFTEIGSFAFSDCSKLTNISIPGNVTIIENGAFYNCGSLENVRLEDGCEELAIKSYTGIAGMNAFNGCQITDLYIGRNLRTMGGSDYSPTFNDQKFLETLTIDGCVTSIRASDFSGCVSLKKVIIGNKVNEIGDYAFYGCCELEKIICYPTKPPIIHENTFGGCGKSIHNFAILIDCKYLPAYKDAQYWSDFINYRSIDTQEQCELSIENITSSQFLIYPNPTIGELRIENGELRIENVTIFDIYGRIQKAECKKLKEEILVDISSLPVGVYFLRITTEQGEVMRKILKE